LTNRYDPVRAFLSRQSWFERLDAVTRQRLLTQCQVRQAAKGECMLPEGDAVDGWYAVLQGMVKLQSSGQDSKVSTFLGIPEGEWFGEGSALKAEPRQYSVIALRDSVLMRMPLPEFEYLRQNNFEFTQFLVSHLNRRLGQAMAIIEAQRIGNPQQRVAMYLGADFWGGTRQLALTQEDLGHLSGLSRQTVNKVLQGLQEQGLVSLEFAQIRVLQPQALAEIGQNRRAQGASN
jgi:CRP-like cAMP-binding protein